MTATMTTPPSSMESGRPPKVLIVDDEHLIRWSLRQRLEDEGYEIVEAAHGDEALEAFRKGCDIVLLDWLLPDINGQEVLRQMRALHPSTPVIMLTAHSSVEHAVDVMKEGAFHYAGKPFDLDEVVETVQLALKNGPPQPVLSRVERPRADDPIIGESPAIAEVKELITRIASSPSATVLINGESGTGKGLAAREIHRASDRSSGPMFAASCSALPALLLESELFGHEPGAFADASAEKAGLLEQADGGTLFLDDIGEMEPSVQGKLLEFLEKKTFRRMGGNTERKADTRVIAATSTDLRGLVEAQRFREDLYYRLAVLTVRLPPLRERKGDVRLLVRYFVDQFNQEFGRNVQGVSEEALRRLENHAWRGNVRELRNCIERAVLLCDDSRLTADAFDLNENVSEGDGQYDLPMDGVDMQELERRLLIQALERANGNRTRAGQLLGMNRDQVRYRIEKFNLEELDPKQRQEPR